MVCFRGGIFAKSVKNPYFFPGKTAELFPIKTIHSKVFAELLYLP